MLRDRCGRRNVVGTILLLGLVPSVDAATLDDLLALAGRAARAATPIRAEVTLTSADGVVEAVLLQRGQTLRFETRDGLRALVHPGKIVVAVGGGVRAAPRGATIPRTDLLLEDLRPVHRGLLAVPQLSDDGPAGAVVTGAPAAPSAYALLVLTIDRERATVVRTQCYRDTVTNLVKAWRVVRWTEVAGRPRPAEATMETYRPASTTTAAFTWRLAPETPAAAFRLAGLRAPASGAR